MRRSGPRTNPSRHCIRIAGKIFGWSAYRLRRKIIDHRPIHMQASVPERQRVLPPEAGERVPNKPPPTNLLLASLSAADLKLLEPHLRPIDLQQHKVLFEAGQSVSAVYFPYDAVVSLVVTLSTGEVIEAAMVGRDGVI